MKKEVFPSKCIFLSAFPSPPFKTRNKNKKKRIKGDSTRLERTIGVFFFFTSETEISNGVRIVMSVLARWRCHTVITFEAVVALASQCVFHPDVSTFVADSIFVSTLPSPLDFRDYLPLLYIHIYI